MSVSVRRALPDDAAGIVAVMEVIAAERIYSAIDRAWSVDEQRKYLQSLSAREAVHVAVDGSGTIVGLQIQAYYRRLGFTECGRLSQQVVIDGVADDEVMMERHL